MLQNVKGEITRVPKWRNEDKTLENYNKFDHANLRYLIFEVGNHV